MSLSALIEFVQSHPRLTLITGAGCSTDSGIPDYRDSDGTWKRGRTPVQGPDFINNEHARRRYWARSMRVWPNFSRAHPNECHQAIASLERLGHIHTLITQNVDNLHGRAGSQNVIELHGSLSRVVCLGCGISCHRDLMQQRLALSNPRYHGVITELRPDGDAELEDHALDTFQVPPCEACGGILKPDVVFFGESVASRVVDACERAVLDADALLCVGTSLMVYSGFRFARLAAANEKPIAAVNLGKTRADDLLSLKVEASCSVILPALTDALAGQRHYNALN